ncbi:MAG: hypothetical protein H7308_18505, partial [Chthonomonadaceae bacterium]|nr:hypothetical protein [Chthonomonadaceae bacterium]
MDNQEEAFIKTFIAEDKQERYLGFIKSSKRRNKFLDDFHHSIILRGAFAVEIPNRERSVEAVEQR